MRKTISSILAAFLVCLAGIPTTMTISADALDEVSAEENQHIVMFADYEEEGAESGFKKYSSGAYVTTDNAVVTDNPLKSGINTSDKVVKITDNGTSEILLTNFEDADGDKAYPYKDKAMKLITSFKLYAAVGNPLGNGSHRDYGYASGPMLTSGESFSVHPGTINTDGTLFGKQLRESNGNMTEWHEIMVIYDFKVTSGSDTYKVYIDGELVRDTTALNNPTVSGVINKGLGFNFTVASKREQFFYLDDIKIQRVYAVNTVTANITDGAVDVDPKTSITLTFNNPVTADGVKAALTISEGAGAIAAERINVTLNEDSTVATVIVDGGLCYDETNYIITLDSEIFSDMYFCSLGEDILLNFTTMKASEDSVIIDSFGISPEDDSITASVGFGGADDKPAWVLVAICDVNGRILAMQEAVYEISVTESTKNFIFENTAALEGADHCRAFIFDSKLNPMPYHMYERVDLNIE